MVISFSSDYVNDRINVEVDGLLVGRIQTINEGMSLTLHDLVDMYIEMIKAGILPRDTRIEYKKQCSH